MFKLTSLVLVSLLVGCTPEPSASASHHTEDTTHVFSETNPNAPLSASAREQLQRALAALAAAGDGADTEQTRELAKQTLARITDGDVLIGSIEGARGIDRWHMCKDFGLGACDGPPTEDPDWLGDDELANTLADGLDGYMWGNRLYFASAATMETEMLAATLVHEVNHVANRSECSYYADILSHEVDDTHAYIEEFRAFLAECFYIEDDGANIDSCAQLAAEHVGEYGFFPDIGSVLASGNDDPVELTRLMVESHELGELVPVASLWQGDFDTCPE